jgi:hypothetical protein
MFMRRIPGPAGHLTAQNDTINTCSEPVDPDFESNAWKSALDMIDVDIFHCK